MTISENNQKAIIQILIYTSLLFLIFVCWHSCNSQRIVTPTKNRDTIIHKIDTLMVHDKVLVDRWHKAIHTTDSVIKLVYFSAPDTCKPYLDTLQVAVNVERARVLDVINSKDSIITQYSALKAVDDTIILNLQTDTTTLRKQVKKRGKVMFGLGYVLGLGTSIIINKLK